MAPIRNERGGLLRHFLKRRCSARGALQLLSNRTDAQQMGWAARAVILDRLSLPVGLPRMRAYYGQVAGRPTSR